jgi:hypothetical protein
MIASVRDEGRAVFETVHERQWAVAYLWVAVGSALKQFCRVRDIDQGASPFPGPIGMRDRLCYMSPRRLSAAILWDTCVNDTGDLQSVLQDLRAALRAE